MATKPPTSYYITLHHKPTQHLGHPLGCFAGTAGTAGSPRLHGVDLPLGDAVVQRLAKLCLGVALLEGAAERIGLGFFEGGNKHRDDLVGN